MQKMKIAYIFFLAFAPSSLSVRRKIGILHNSWKSNRLSLSFTVDFDLNGGAGAARRVVDMTTVVASLVHADAVENKEAGLRRHSRHGRFRHTVAVDRPAEVEWQVPSRCDARQLDVASLVDGIAGQVQRQERRSLCKRHNTIGS